MYHDEHALLGLGKEHFPAFHVLLAGRYLVEVDDHTMLAFGGHFSGGAGDTCSAHVLHANESIGFHHFQTGFKEFLFLEGVAYLNGREIFSGFFSNVCGGEGGAADTVFTGSGPYDEHGVARAVGGSGYHGTYFQHAHAHGVHEGLVP